MASSRSDIGCADLRGVSAPSHLRPLAVAFPDPDVERELDFLVQALRDELADVLDGRVLEERVPVLVVVVRQNRAEVLLQIREVEEHAAFVVPLDVDVNLVRVPVQGTAALVAREVMRAVDVLGDSEFHRFRPKVRAAIKLGLRALDRRDGEELQRPLASLQELVLLVRLNEQHDPRTQREFLPADQGDASPRHDECGHSQSAEERTPNQDRVQSTGTLYGVIRMFTMMPENMLAANRTSRAMTHPPAPKFSLSDPPRWAARN